jgi:ABC-2 type transport system permease protein
VSVEAAKGVIHDIGYQRYDGRRLGRAYARTSLFTHGVRSAFGLGRSAKAKAFPWIVVGLLFVIAAVLAAIRAQSGQVLLEYRQFPYAMWVFSILFCAVVAPELVSRDLRGGVLPLYFSRPLTRWDYALSKLAALMASVFALLAGPMLLMYIGGVFSVSGGSAIWHETLHFLSGLAVAGVNAVLFASIALLIASLAGRRAVAAALIVAFFLITQPVFGVLMGVAYSRANGEELTGANLTITQVAPMVSPMGLADGIGQWWFDDSPNVGPYGALYLAVGAGLVAIAVLLLLVRYRKVAR